MKATVTGGAGFIGSHLVEALIARGWETVVLDNFRRGRREWLAAGASVIDGDLRDPAAVARAVDGAEVVFHLGAQSNVIGAGRDLQYSFDTNVAGTVNVLAAAAHAGARRLVFASSREVYGEPRKLPVGEDAPLLAKNLYGASKVAAEAYCRAWTGEMTVQVLRFANVYGPRDTDRVIPLWIARALREEPIELFGGDQILDFVPVATAVEALAAAASCPATTPINVASGAGTALPDLAEQVLELAGTRSTLVWLPPRDVEVRAFVGRTERMVAHLGVVPPAHALDALPELLRWHRQNGGEARRAAGGAPAGGMAGGSLRHATAG